jgi:Tfp pilus assembly protein PilN
MLKNIRPYLADRLGVQVEILNPFKNVGVPKNLVNVRKASPMFATAVGLALRSSGDCCQLKISLIPPKLKEAKSRRVKVICNAISAVLIAVMAAFYVMTAIPKMAEIEEELKTIESEIERYAKYEPDLIELETKRDIAVEEFEMYAQYPNQHAVDVVTPLAILKETVKDDVWINSLRFKGKRDLMIAGSIESGDERVEGMRQLSELRKDLEKYCGEDTVEVKGQGPSRTGITFTINARKMPDINKFMETQAAERQKAAEEEANKQKAGEAEKEEDVASEQAPKAADSKEQAPKAADSKDDSKKESGDDKS